MFGSLFVKRKERKLLENEEEIENIWITTLNNEKRSILMSINLSWRDEFHEGGLKLSSCWKTLIQAQEMFLF
jgi:hypothetical protein